MGSLQYDFVGTRFVGSHPRWFCKGLEALAGGVAFFALSGGTVLDRLARTSTEEGLRPKIYELTLDAISDAPWLGTGYGTFPDVFRMYRDESVPSIVERAHNTYLENALELGWPAAAALFLAVAVCALYCALGVRRRRRDAIYPAVGVATSTLAELRNGGGKPSP